MAYKKYVWIDEESPLNAENLNNIENGINELMNGEFIIDIYGTKVNLNLNPDTNLFTISLLSNSGKILDTKSIILNSSGDTLKTCSLDDTNKRLIFTLTSGSKVYCDLTALYDKFNNYVTNEKFENLVKVTPTDININSNNELYLEHDGEEITGQTKKIRVATPNDLNNKVSKISIADQPGSIVYGRNSDGTDVAVKYRAASNYGYDLIYRDGYGRSQINDPINPLDIANKQYVDAKTANIYTFKGSVNTYNDLPTNANNGDVYDIKKAYESYPAGTNFAWTGEKWDSLGGSIDLTNYVTQTNLTNILNNYVTNTYLSQTLTDYVSNDALTGILNSYATTASLNNHINNKSNPHGVTKTQIGLENVDNTSDQNKPVSTAQQEAINNTGHTLNIVDDEIQLLNANSQILSKQILPKLEMAELNTIYYNIDGTLTDEQLTYLKSFKNLMFLKVKYNETSASAIDIFLSKVRTVGTSQIVFTFNHSSGNMNIGYAANSLVINLVNKTYAWSTTSVGVITDHNIHYDVNGTLSSSTLSAMNEFANSSGNLLLHLIIGGVSSIGYDYLTYTSHEIAGKTKITFISDGYKKIVINLTDGTYTFEVSQVETLPITQDDYDNLETKDSNILYVIKE